jgi:hypothetical protein
VVVEQSHGVLAPGFGYYLKIWLVALHGHIPRFVSIPVVEKRGAELVDVGLHVKQLLVVLVFELELEVAGIVKVHRGSIRPNLVRWTLWFSIG